MIPCKRRVWQRVWGSAVAAGVVVVGACAWPYTVDDAFIVARYARRIARGLGYTYNAGPATDGVTGPAWLLPEIVAVHFGADPIGVAKLLGLLASAASAFVLVCWIGRRCQGAGMALVAGALLLAQPTLACTGISGLETGAATLLMVLAARFCLRRPTPAAYAGAAAIGALAWLRPELAFAGGVLALALIARVGFARALPALLLAVMAAASVCVFRLALFGHLLPLALAAKPASLAHGTEYTARAIAVLTAGAGVVLALAGARLGRRDDRWIAAVLVAHAAACTLGGGDWMPGFRLFAPVLPLYAGLAAVGSVRLCQRWRAHRWLWVGLSVCALAVPLLDLTTRLPALRAAAVSRETAGKKLALWLRGHSRRVALVDIGYLGYASERAIVDLAGLTDPEIARLEGEHLDKRIPLRLLRARAPDTVVLHSSAPPRAAADGTLLWLHGYPVEQRIAHSAWLQGGYRVAAIERYAPHYYYVALLRSPP